MKQVATRISSNLVWVVVSEVLGKGVFFLSSVYLARVLHADQFGLFALVQTVTGYFWLAVDLGTGMYGIREIAKHPEAPNDIIGALLSLRIAAGIVMFALFAAGIAICPLPPESKVAFLGGSVYLVAYSCFPDWILKGLEHFRYLAFGTSVTSLAFLAAILCLVREPGDVARAATLWACSFFLGTAILGWIAVQRLGLRVKLSISPRIWFTHIRESILFTVSGGLLSVYQYLPTVLLGLFYSTDEVGVFSAPYRLVIVASGLGVMFSISSYPVMSSLYRTDRGSFLRTLRSSVMIAAVTGTAIAVAGALCGNYIVRALFGTEYLSSAGVFAILIWIVPFYFVRPLYGTALLAAGLQRLHNLSSLMGVVACVVCGLALVPRFGTKGAAVALLIAECFIMASMYLLFHSQSKKMHARVA